MIIQLKILTPQKKVVEEEVQSVTVPSAEGEITILPRHAKLLTTLREGIITIRKNSSEDHLSIGGGYLETDGKELRILVSQAYHQHEINEEMTKKALEDARRIMQESKDQPMRVAAEVTIRRSVIDLKLLRKKRRTNYQVTN